MDENSTSKKFLLVQKEGNREVKRNIQYYNLDMVISVGYRVKQDKLYKSDFDLLLKETK